LLCASAAHFIAALQHCMACLCQCLRYHCISRRMSGSADPSWAQQDKRRVLVIDIRVQNVEHTQQFYEQHLGMRLWRRLGDLQQGQFTSVCGYGKTNYSCVWLCYDSLLVCVAMARLGRQKVGSFAGTGTLFCGYNTLRPCKGMQICMQRPIKLLYITVNHWSDDGLNTSTFTLPVFWQGQSSPMQACISTMMNSGLLYTWARHSAIFLVPTLACALPSL
jgi:hypothetical protein